MVENPTWALAIEGFEIEQVERSVQGWLIHARSTEDEHRCLCCGAVTRRVHSYYHRQLRDLSVDGQAVRLRITVKRMRCLNAVSAQDLC
jgi:transposase